MKHRVGAMVRSATDPPFTQLMCTRKRNKLKRKTGAETRIKEITEGHSSPEKCFPYQR